MNSILKIQKKQRPSEGCARWRFVPWRSAGILLLALGMTTLALPQGTVVEDAKNAPLQWWRGTLETDGGPLPFEFTTQESAKGSAAKVYNGAEELPVGLLHPRGTWSFRFHPYGSVISAQSVDDQGELLPLKSAAEFLKGSWGECVFRAHRTSKRERFAPSKDLTQLHRSDI